MSEITPSVSRTINMTHMTLDFVWNTLNVFCVRSLSHVSVITIIVALNVFTPCTQTDSAKTKVTVTILTFNFIFTPEDK